MERKLSQTAIEILERILEEQNRQTLEAFDESHRPPTDGKESKLPRFSFNGYIARMIREKEGLDVKDLSKQLYEKSKILVTEGMLEEKTQREVGPVKLGRVIRQFESGKGKARGDINVLMYLTFLMPKGYDPFNLTFAYFRTNIPFV